MASPASTIKIKSAVLALGFTAITVTGVIYGANLRTERTQSKQLQKRMEMTNEERVAHLEGQREEVISQRDLLDRKIREFEKKAASRRALKEGEV
ncbi:MAG: hypothetical protein M1823_000714 [Watsoniomyces obsoletus]|nr:MAG: hypothetical protein M1823_000714 [Watsoniomyces obsoletus]